MEVNHNHQKSLFRKLQLETLNIELLSKRDNYRNPYKKDLIVIASQSKETLKANLKR